MKYFDCSFLSSFLPIMVQQPAMFFQSRRLVAAALFIIGASVVAVLSAAALDDEPSRTTSSHSFRHVDERGGRRRSRRLSEETSSIDSNNPFPIAADAQVVGPTTFPKPTDIQKDDNVPPLVPFIQPVLGTHRPSHDAVLVFASEYALNNYILFIESLRATGYSGDIVMCVHPNDWKKPAIQEYFKSYGENTAAMDPHVVIYAPEPVCYTQERAHVDSSKGGMRTCQFHNLYGTKSNDDGSIVGVPDPRSDRTVANIRYELYWLMAIHYAPHSWLMLVDARDTVFQVNPFAHVPRRQSQSATGNEGSLSSTTSSTNVVEPGLLYFFGENRDATRIGLSKQNNKWIRTAYGDVVGDAVSDRPTICSGATLGEQVALETYLRAMVTEADETGTVLMGSDQGFHNRLYYSGKLTNAKNIKSITVYDQGTGIVNNMGALRTKPLNKWGNGHIVEQNGKDYKVLNWDGSPSPVVHQFDRHKELSQYFFKDQTKIYLDGWRERHSK